MKKPRSTSLASVALLSFGMLSASGAEPPAPATKGEPAKVEEKDKGVKSQAKEPEVKPAFHLPQDHAGGGADALLRAGR